MTDALAKWAAALDTFDGLKHNFQAPGQVEKALNSIAALEERVMLFRGSDSDIVERLSAYDQVKGLKSLDEVSVLAAATARELQRLQQEEDSDIISCVASQTSFSKARSAAHQLGFTVEGVDCILPAKAEQKPTQPAYVWENPEDSRQEAAKIVARLSQELELPTKKLHATTVFANLLGKVSKSKVRLSAKTDVVIHHAAGSFVAGPSDLNRYLMTWEIKTTAVLKAKRAAAEGQALVEFLAINILAGGAGWGIPVVLSDLTEACVFQRGKQAKDIIQMRFSTLEQAYAYIRWLLDEAKEHRPPPSFDASCGPPADDMSTVWEKAEASLPDGYEGLLDE